MSTKVMVIKVLGSEDSKPYAVVEYVAAIPYNFLKIWGWHYKEDDARASAHRIMFPDYD